MKTNKKSTKKPIYITDRNYKPNSMVQIIYKNKLYKS